MLFFLSLTLSGFFSLTQITFAQEATEEPSILPEVTEESPPQDHHILERPIALRESKVHWADRTYPYGSTRFGTLQSHLGVDFTNNRFTPVEASADGEVIFAGNDSETLIGPQHNFYGNVVILAHEIETHDGLQLFTLYGHLEEVLITEGTEVVAGDRLGTVGSSGIAIGAHLHFEVRAGSPFDFTATRNPELWLQHYINHGTLAGRVVDLDGNMIPDQEILVRADGFQRDVFTYNADMVNSDPVWQENFLLGDVPAGEYVVTIRGQGGSFLYRNTVVIHPYETTWLEIVIALPVVEEVEGE